MKKFIAIALTASGLISAAWVYANQPGREGGRWEKRLEHLKTELNLTADQESKIRDVLEKQGEKMRVLREETRQSVSSILTPEQRQKFEEMKEHRRQ